LDLNRKGKSESRHPRDKGWVQSKEIQSICNFWSQWRRKDLISRKRAQEPGNWKWEVEEKAAPQRFRRVLQLGRKGLSRRREATKRRRNQRGGDRPSTKNERQRRKKNGLREQNKTPARAKPFDPKNVGQKQIHDAGEAKIKKKNLFRSGRPVI